MAKKKTASTTTRSLYSVHPAVAYTQAVIKNIPEKTGRSMEEWVRIIRADGPSGEAQVRNWLKKRHKLGGTTAWLIAERAEGKKSEASDPGEYLRTAAVHVEAMYAGPKAGLRPIHDALIKLVRSLGKDVKICPCKTIVPLYRQHVFAQICPRTRTRIDLGLALKGTPRSIPKRLIDTGGLKKGDRITHRIPVSSLAEIDAELKEWTRVAYELDG